MPWFVVPNKDRTSGQDLCQIFDVKEILALVLIGPEGQTIVANGKAVISSYELRLFCLWGRG